MNYWLIKTEPGAWSWDDQVAAPKKTTNWSGVRNAQAAINLRAMKKGDRCLFYHSVTDKAVVGIVEVAKTAYPDPGDEAGKAVQVDVKAVMPFAEPVTLAAIKGEKSLANIALIRQSRLSVMPLDAAQYETICQMGKTS
ncbi:MAG: EVE domain-containing protein [Planctomycetes bacterium]|nr:EVE domain-containing protein [Planctomycetota bacterium]